MNSPPPLEQTASSEALIKFADALYDHTVLVLTPFNVVTGWTKLPSGSILFTMCNNDRVHSLIFDAPPNQPWEVYINAATISGLLSLLKQVS